MKLNNFLFIAGLTLIHFSSYSQLTMNSSGKIGVGTFSPNPSYNMYGAVSYFSTSNSSYGYVNEAVGIGTNYSTLYTLRVYPRASETDYALYLSDGTGGTDSYTLYVSGDAFSTGGWLTSSDKKVKKEIKDIDKSEVSSKLQKIQAKSFKYKSREELTAMHYSGEASFPVDTLYRMREELQADGTRTMVPTTEIDEIVVDAPQYRDGVHYGFLAQDLMEEFPDLVSLDEKTGLYAVDYQGFIPLLLQAFNEQQKLIADLQEELVKPKGNNRLQDGQFNTLGNKAYFDQNVPNPSNGSIKIKYFVPEESRKAVMNVYDLRGGHVKSYDLKKGENSLIIDSGDIKKGLYLYTMSVDGNSMDTKKMIIE